MRRNNRSKKPGVSQGGKNTRIDHIPQTMPFPVVKSTKRYTATAFAAINIDSKDLLMSGGAMCTVVNSTLSALFSSARIRRVEIWCPVSTSLAPIASATTSICLLWGGSPTTAAGGVQYLISDTTLSSVHPAHIVSKPPKGSQASWWRQSDTVENLFQIYSYGAAGNQVGVPIGTIVEVDVEFTQQVLSGAPTTLAVGTAALGITYYPTLDSSGSKMCMPVGLLSTV